MSLYNMVAGYDPLAPLVLRMLGLTMSDVPRLRDAYVVPHGEDGGPELVVYTRTGGGNRDFYAEENRRMREVPGFLGDRDSDLDETFAHFRYRVPEEFREPLQHIVDSAMEQGYGFPTPEDRMRKFLGEDADGPPVPEDV